MTKNNQLMTGNKVLYKGQVMTIDGITRGHVILEELNPSKEKYSDWIDLDEIEFIPLTKELVQTVILAKYNHYDVWDISVCVEMSFSNNEWILRDEPTNKEHRTLEFFHQLQNVYYWLNNEELTFKP